MNDSDKSPIENKEEMPTWLSKADSLRFIMPEEQKYPWLNFLLDAYALVDASTQAAIEESEEKIACTHNCAYCCYQYVPVSPAEAMGIRLTIHAFLPRAEREPLLVQLAQYKGDTKTTDEKNEQCPFLIDNYCAIYAFRPMACRRVLRAVRTCTSVEDFFQQQNVVSPDPAALYAALAHTSPIYESLGITEEGKILTFDSFQNLFVDIRTIDWT